MAEPGNAVQDDERQQPGFSWKNFMIQMIAFQLIMKLFSGFRGSPTPNKDPLTGELIPPLVNAYAVGAEYDLFLHVAPFVPADWTSLVTSQNATLLLTKGDLTYSHVRFASDFVANITYTPDDILYDILTTQHLPERQSDDKWRDLYLIATTIPHDAYIERDEENLVMSEIDPISEGSIAMGQISLIEYTEPFSNDDELHNLLGSTDTSAEDDASQKRTKEEKIPHWKSKINMRMVFDTTQHTTQSISVPTLRKHMRYNTADGNYLPIIYMSDFWLLEREYIQLNETLKGVPLNMTVSWNSMTQWWFMLQSQMSEAWDTNAETKNPFSFQQHSRKETFMLKRILLDTSPIFLAFSAGFISLHTVFSFLAFKNDIHFWHSNHSMEGLSALSVLISFICEIVIGLYLFDSEKTSWLIMCEIIVGIAISGWKLTKAVKISPSRTWPFLKIQDGHNYTKSDTKKYDERAIKFMSILLFPCLVGYAIYALHYNKYKSWYSYVVSTLAGTVYLFGFIMMTPQLYINYKLQSVDHLPWRALVYKALNTFVDDIAAFIIDMPWMHRLACFRDDIIFVFYLYQRWAYRVDKTRPSEWVDPKETQKAAEEEKQKLLMPSEEAAGSGGTAASGSSSAEHSTKEPQSVGDAPLRVEEIFSDEDGGDAASGSAGQDDSVKDAGATTLLSSDQQKASEGIELTSSSDKAAAELRYRGQRQDDSNK